MGIRDTDTDTRYLLGRSSIKVISSQLTSSVVYWSNPRNVTHGFCGFSALPTTYQQHYSRSRLLVVF